MRSHLITTSRRRTALTLITLLLTSVSISAQTNSSTDKSTPSYLTPGAPAGSYALSSFDNVNLFNGNLNFHLPLIGLEGRGGAHMRSMLNIEQRWRVDHYYNEWDRNFINSANYNWWTGVKPGYGAGVLVGRTAVLRTSECLDANGNYRMSAGTIVTRLTFTMADGTEYELHDQLYDGQPLDQPATCTQWGVSRGNVFVGWDGSATTFISDTIIYDNLWSFGESYTLFYPSGVLLLKDGTRYRIDNGLVSWMRDRNGNKLSFTHDPQYKRVTSITDSLNREVTITYDVQDVAPYGLCDKLTFSGFGGAPRTLRVSRTNLVNALRSGYSISSDTQLFPELNGGCTNCFINPVVTSAVWLPDGRAYKFFYNNYAELARVVVPTGGAYEYDYAAGLSNAAASGVWPSYSTSDDAQIYRRVVEKRVYANGNVLTGKMTFSRPESISTAGWPQSSGVVTQDSLGAGGALLTRAEHYFHGSAIDNADVGLGFDPWLKGKEHKTEHLASNGTTVLRREEQTWQQRAHVWWWAGWAAKVAPPSHASQDYAPALDPRLVTTLTTLEPNGPNLVKKQTAINPASGNVGFDQYHNQTDSWEYDYGVGAAPAHAVRHTHTDFVYINPANNSIDYASQTGAHIRNLPGVQQVYAVDPANGVETLAAHSTTTYDEGGYPLLPYAAVAGWTDPGTTARGNTTSTSRWLNTTGGWLTTHAQYDQTGNLRKTWDAKGHLSELIYSDSFTDGNNGRNTYAFPTATTSAVPDPSGARGSSTSLTTATTYDYWTGHVTATTDTNAKTTTVQYNDPLDRVTRVARPDGGQTTYDYIDSNPCGSYIQTRTRLDTAGRQTDAYQFFDGLGRAVRTFHYDGQDSAKPFLTSDIEYDGLGRRWRVSNPYRSAGCTSSVNPSGYWTTTQFDGLSRVMTVTTPDGASVISNYIGNTATVTDQTGKQRMSVSDALGLLTSVSEDPGGLNYQTTYRYDALGNLRKATQDTQHRFFLYDSLGRLIRSKNPEQQVNGNLNLTDSVTGNNAWSLAYAYDNNGNISTRTDARGITTTYTYDALNRTTLVDYSNTASNPDIDRRYDNPNNNGRGYYWHDYFYKDDGRIDHQAIDAYDVMGRPTARRQVFHYNGQWHHYGMSRIYDQAGHALIDTYPSGRVVNYNYDLAGRLGDNGSSLALTGNLGDGVTRTYATALEYDAANRLQQEKFGMATALYHKLHYNLRGQLYDTRLSTVSFATDKWNWNRGALANYYSTAEQFASTNTARALSGPNNNGNLLRSGTFVPLDPNGTYTEGNNSAYAFTQDDYGYDKLNRLSSMSEVSGTQAGMGWYNLAQTYKYDRWGNRTLDLDTNCGANRMGTRYFVANIYQVTLSRGADFDGWRAWNNYLREGYALGASEMLAHAKTTVAGFFHSLEYINRGRPDRDYVRDLYLAYLNREPDQGGWDAWTNVVATQGREVVLNGFANSQEFANSAANLCPSGMTFGSVNSAAYNVNQATNQLTPVGAGAMNYDQAGNLIYDQYTPLTTWGTRSYDAENRMIQQDNTLGQLISKYNYDADGHRVRRHISGTEAWQVYGFDGQLWAEYAAGAATSAPQKEYGYRSGELLITATEGGSVGGSSSSSAAATFIRSDTTTQGSWKGAYGSDGYSLVGDGASYPTYAQVSVTGHQTYTWAASTTDVRALQKSATGSTDRIASTWFSPTEYTFDINLTDGQEHQVALYALDWDGNNARTMRVEARDAATNALLGSRDVTAFSGGHYVVWKLRGHVKLKVVYTGTGINAVVSGLFFDPAGGGTNLAQGKTATQSSTYDAGVPAARAVDGNTSGSHNAGTISHTNNEANAWWQVDLGSGQTISTIKVWNRADCCTFMTSNFYVLVSDAPFTSTNLSATLSQTGVSNYHVTGEAGAPTTVSVGRTGRYVRVQLAGMNYLTLSEVQVFEAGGNASSSLAPVNPGFETPSLGTGYQYTPANAGWTFTGGAGVSGNGNGFTSGNPAAPEGSQVCFLQNVSAASQPVSGFAANTSYTVRFKAAQRGNHATGAQQVEVFLDNTSLGVFQPVGTSYTELSTAGFTTTTGTHTLRFEGRNVAGDMTVFIDDVKVTTSGGAGGAGGGAGSINWLISDHLGSPRMIADLSGNLTGIKRHDYLPFGEEMGAGISGRTTSQGYSQLDGVRMKFTGHERDDETGLDFMKARYYSSMQGRFTSVDPSSKSIIPTNPQTWNRYSYTYNNPLRYVDQNGKWPTSTHDRILEKAFNGLNKQQLREIQKGSESVDANLQKPVRLILENTLVEGLAFRHAMTPGSMVREKGSVRAAQDWARAEATNFINDRMGEAKQINENSRNKNTVPDAALYAFGQGSHPITDGSSPSHREFQVYDLAPYKALFAINPVWGITAYKTAMDAHTEEESREPTQDEMNHMVDDLRMQYLNAFGREMYERAVSLEERDATDRRRNARR